MLGRVADRHIFLMVNQLERVADRYTLLMARRHNPDGSTARKGGSSAHNLEWLEGSVLVVRQLEGMAVRHTILGGLAARK